MYRKNYTWFGFNITQKQAVQIFTLSLVGIIFSIFLFLSLLLPYFINFIFYGYTYDPGNNYLLQMFISMSPFFVLLLSIFILSVYSVVRCRKIAKYYSYHMFNPPKSENVPQYCQNCGQLRVIGHNFCKNCGELF